MMSTMKFFLLIFLDIYVEVHSVFNAPDFESPWTEMKTRTDKTFLKFDHGLGEMPLLVDVEIKSQDEPNLNYVFPGVGSCTRDDDNGEYYGVICYLYNENKIQLSTPVLRNHFDTGRSIYAVQDTYFDGPNTQISDRALVRVRMWKEGSLPPADFNMTGLTVQSRSQNLIDVYKEVDHHLNEYPALVIVRTKLGTGVKTGYMSDAIGSSIVVPPNPVAFMQYVVYGFDDISIRVWIPSNPHKGYLFYGQDGFNITGVVSDGAVEIYAWTKASLMTSLVQTGSVGVGVTNEDFQIPFKYRDLRNIFVRAWAEAEDGPNRGYRFPGSGAAAYISNTVDLTCTYGGLTYAYSADDIRIWRPTNATNGGIICVAQDSGLGTNVQRSTSAKIVSNIWILKLDIQGADQLFRVEESFCEKTPYP